MGAFLSLIGGAGNQAAHYGEEMRGHLESRRNELAHMIGQAAEVESDPNTITALRGHQADLLAGKPMGSIAQKFYGTLQKRHQDMEAMKEAHANFSQLAGQAATPPPVAPGPATGGATPGTVGGPAASSPPNPFTIGGITDGHAPNSMASMIGQAPPAPPPAAQPATSPVQPAAQAAAPEPAPSIQPVGMPQVRDNTAIIQEMLSNPAYAAPVNRGPLAAAAQAEISHNESIRQFKDQIQYKRAQLEEFKKTPTWAALPDPIKGAYEAEASGLTAAPMSAALMAPKLERVRAEDLSPDVKAEHGIPQDATGTWLLHKSQINGSAMSPATPGATPYSMVATPNGLTMVPHNPGALPAGSMPVGAANLRGVGVDASGHPLFNDAFGIKSGAAPAKGAGTNPSFIPSVSSSTTAIPGQPTEHRTTVKTKGGVGAPSASGSIQPVAGPSGVPGATAKPSGGDDITKQAYESWVSGGPAPSGKTLNAVRDYQQKNGLPDPVTLSPGGQKSLAAIDPVMDEIKRTREQLQKAIKGGLSQGQLAKDWVKYNLHQDSPNTELISNMSFSALRSAVTALAGSGSRAYPVLKMALEHTPSALGDPTRSLKLLNEMETRITEARDAVLKDERKSGTIQSVEGAPSGSSVDDLVRKYGGK